jgi:uncharacterized FAD-dependent dehydrogenase
VIEVRNLKLGLAHASAQGVPYDPERLAEAVSRKLGIPVRTIERCEVARRAVDARHKDDVHFVVTARASLFGGDAAERSAVKAARSGDVVLWNPADFQLPKLKRSLAEDGERPVVIGAGCAGLFCALVLARAGASPILIERGDDPTRRRQAIAKFERTGILDPQSNVQFGCGGAGMFSDGKLTTGTRSPAIPWILREMAAAGAPADILWEARPHVGSDRLPGMVCAILSEIERLGGVVHLRTKADELVIEEGRLVGIRTSPTLSLSSQTDSEPGKPARPCPDFLEAQYVVLACGHSARDTYEMLLEQGVSMERKAFSMGVRIEHLQRAIDRAQYGRAAGNPALPHADYKLATHLRDGRGVYTFCMCPGGYVVAAASEPGRVVTNGMSEFARDGSNANSALLVGVEPNDIEGDSVLGGIELQRACESRAFELGGGEYIAPAQLAGDFLAGTPSTQARLVKPTYPRGVRWGSIETSLPGFVIDALRAGIRDFGRRLHGFDDPDAVLTAVETRSSSPVRVLRNKGRESVSTPGLFPCGEGAGYAGGIMSAAADGVASACAVVEALNSADRN